MVVPSERASECAERIRMLYGDDLEAEAGVLHVTSVWQGPVGPPFVLRINDSTPVSEWDAFVLALARARADAIVTTGAILRDEPGMTHDFDVSGLPAWRNDVLGKALPPQSVILSSGRAIDFAHPIFRARRALLYTARDHPPDLPERAAAAGVRLLTHPDPDLRNLIAHLRAETGARTISIEAGPSTALTLYRDPLAVDELMLSVCRAPTLPEVARGAPFLFLEQLERALPGSTRNDSAEPGWSFHRLTRTR